MRKEDGGLHLTNVLRVGRAADVSGKVSEHRQGWVCLPGPGLWKSGIQLWKGPGAPLDQRWTLGPRGHVSVTHSLGHRRKRPPAWARPWDPGVRTCRPAPSADRAGLSVVRGRGPRSGRGGACRLPFERRMKTTSSKNEGGHSGPGRGCSPFSWGRSRHACSNTASTPRYLGPASVNAGDQGHRRTSGAAEASAFARGASGCRRRSALATAVTWLASSWSPRTHLPVDTSPLVQLLTEATRWSHFAEGTPVEVHPPSDPSDQPRAWTAVFHVTAVGTHADWRGHSWWHFPPGLSSPKWCPRAPQRPGRGLCPGGWGVRGLVGPHQAPACRPDWNDLSDSHTDFR